MAPKVVENEAESHEHDRHAAFYQASRKILLAAIGAVVIAQDEIEAFVSRLAERGEIAEKDARRLMKEMMERREKLYEERHAEDRKGQPAAATKADIDALTARIAELTKKIEEMKKEQK
jgi:polyhydroxyalkanoate synthesis regulator phasin